MHLEGQIYYQNSSLEGVWVWDKSDDRYVRSDKDGAFRIERLSSGDKELIFWKPGFYSTTVKIPEKGNSNWSFVDHQRNTIKLMRNYDNPQVMRLVIEMVERKVRSDCGTYVTYTCPVSNLTYAGRPNRGHFVECPTDLVRATKAIYEHSRKHGQPVTWVINDQEYTDQNGLLSFFKMCQQQGDAIVVTPELTTRPQVDVDDFSAVLCWIQDYCREVELHIDGLWSLKFYESDFEAILRLPRDEFGWARNLAGSCWHQYAIDDSTWGGCPFGPYYPALHNVKGVSNSYDNGNILMLEWLTRDINAILRGGFPATFSLDPADAMRIWAGGYSDEWEGLSYSVKLMDELARQTSAPDGSRMIQANVVHINEEARLYYEEGHDKDILLAGMFEHAHRSMDVVQTNYREIWRIFREKCPRTPERVYSFGNLDYRQVEDDTLLFEDEKMQAGFVQSKCSLPTVLWDYSKQHSGGDNIPYPKEDLSGIEIVKSEYKLEDSHVFVEFVILAPQEQGQFAVALWNLGLFERVEMVSDNPNVVALRSTVDGHGILRLRLEKGTHTYRGVFRIIQPVGPQLQAHRV